MFFFMMIIIKKSNAEQVNFQGALVESLPCTINNGEIIEVNFEDNIVIRNVDGYRYSKQVPYSISCINIGSVRISINGTQTNFDDAAILSSIPGLGIHMSIGNGMPLIINSYVNIINAQSPPEIRAVPVIDPKNAPLPGAFTANATLLAEYE